MRTLLLTLMLLLPVGAYAIDQTWYDAHDGILDVADTTYTLTQDISSQKWGFIFASDRIRLNGNGYTLTFDDNDSVIVWNHSFETADTDTTRAVHWDFSDADSVTRRAGRILHVGDERAGVWTGDYSLRVGLPCSDQFIKSESLFAFAPGLMWTLSVQAYNWCNNDVRMGIGLLTADGDTAYQAYLDYGTYDRGFMTNWLDFANNSDSIEYYRIMLIVRNGDSTATECANGLRFDDVRIQTSHYHGIVFDCNPTINQDGGALYQSGDVVGKYCPEAQYDTYTGGSGCMVQNLSIVGGNGRSFIGYGVLGMGAAGSDTIYNCTIVTKGIGSFCVKTDNAVAWRVSNDSLFNYATAAYGKRDYTGTMVGYVHATGGRNSYGHGSSFDSNYCEGSIHDGLVVTTKVDNTDNEVTEYALSKIFGNTIHHSARYSNGFAIHCIEQAGAGIFDNIIESDSGDFYGRGIYLGYLGPTYGPKPYVRGNTIKVLQKPREGYYQWPGSFHATYGIQLDDGVDACSLTYNDIVVSADSNWAGRFAACGFVCWANVVNDVRFAHNRIWAYGNDNNWASCLGLADLDSGNMLIDSNEFYTTDSWIRGSWNIDTLIFRGNTWGYPDTGTVMTDWSPFQHYDYGGPMDGMFFLDNVYPNDSARSLFESSHFVDYGNGIKFTQAALGNHWQTEWTTTLDVNDSAGAADGAHVRVVDVLGDTVYIADTDISGLLYPVLPQFRDSAQTITYDVQRDRTEYNDYTFIAWSADWVSSDTAVATVDRAQTVTLTLAGSEPVTKTEMQGITVKGVTIE